MISILTKFGLILLIIIAAAAVGFAQIDASNDGFRRRERDIDPPKSFTEMLAKQRLSKEKKDHEQMIARGDEAVEIAKQLEESFEKDNQVSRADLEKLKTLEEIVMKIRKELGGDDDDDDEDQSAEKNEKPSSAHEAFKFLQSNTVKLVDELKKTSRYSISVVAIQSSNSVLKLVRFLRLRN